MADIAYPAELTPLPGGVQGRVPERYAGAFLAPLPGGTLDVRHQIPTTGTITDQVVLKTGATEVPFVLGRVWLLRAADGFKAWEGWTDATGAYTATGLELGVEYIAVGIDPYRNQKATGAGPVMAT
ncbi:MAG: hypothetical protein Q8S71_11965 [Hydrogenophaga sp.]|nr:hypothetical protein [Hydrogenophaga sp.]